MSRLKLICKIAQKGKIELTIIVVLFLVIVCVNIYGNSSAVGIINSLATSAIITLGWNLATKYNNAKQSYIQITTLMRILIDKLSDSKDLKNTTITIKDIKTFKNDINSTYINVYGAISNMLVASECDEITTALRDILYRIEHEQDCQSVNHNIGQLQKSLNNFNWK